MRVKIKQYQDEDVCKVVNMDQTEFAEQTGYLTTRQLVERFMESGRRLSSYRKGFLDFDEDDDYEDQEAADIYDYDEPTHYETRLRGRQRTRVIDESVSGEKTEKKPDETPVVNSGGEGDPKGESPTP